MILHLSTQPAFDLQHGILSTQTAFYLHKQHFIHTRSVTRLPDPPGKELRPYLQLDVCAG